MRKVIYILIATTIVAAAGTAAWIWLRDNKMSNFNDNSELYVYPEESSDAVLARIIEDCSPINTKSLTRSFRSKDVANNIKPGHYRITEGNSSVYVARMLNNGWQTPVKLTIGGNLRIKSNIAKKISSQLMLDSAEVHNALNDEKLLEGYGFTPSTVFSLLMPDTYEIYWTASIKDVLDRQKKALDTFWTEENLSKAAEFGLSKEEVSILASIVKGETNYEPEMPEIAGVYLNRLKIGMPLQADPTIAFCHDYKPYRILKRHLQIESPYNTYKHTGLPPGPICVPTRACLEAVLNPDFGGNWGKGNLYFCANADFSGTHSFAKTLPEHNANARAFQRELTRRTRNRQ